MKNVLIVAYYFPPFGGGAVARVHSFAKYLPAFGFRPVVLTVEPSYYESHFLDESLLQEYSDDVELIRTRSFEPGGRQIKDAVFGKAKRSLPKEIKMAFLRWSQQHLLIPDRCILWRRHALRAGRRLLAERKVCAILATMPPATNIGVGHALAKSGSVPLIVDYRDLWTGNPIFQPATWIRSWAERSLEKRWVGGAVAVLAATEEMASRLKELHPALENRIRYLPNGFDPARYRIDRSVRNRKTRVRFTHAGALTTNRSPKYFLHAVAKAIEQDPTLRARIEIRFYGFLADAHGTEIERLGLSSLIHNMGFVSAAETARILQEETDVALLFQRRSDGGETAIPGKLYDYLASGCAILAMCDPGATTNLLGRLEVGCITRYEDVSAIAAAIATLSKTVEQNPAVPILPESRLARFDRSAITRELANIITDGIDNVDTSR